MSLAVNQPHQALITGMYTLYMTLVTMGYLEKDEVAWPPQTSRFNAKDWLNHGLSQEVVEVLKLLPCIDLANLTSDMFGILPDAAPANFFDKPGSSYATHPRCSGGFSTAPTWLPIASSIGSECKAWYYNVADRTIGMYSSANDTCTGSVIDVPITREPAQQVLDTWVSHLRDLSWMPDRSANQGPILVLADIQALHPALDGAKVHPLRRKQTRLNAFYARRRIYREHGWPTEQYRRDDCRAALANFNAQLETLEQSVFAATQPSIEPGQYDPESQAKSAGQYAAFLKDAAGDEADRGFA